MMDWLKLANQKTIESAEMKILFILENYFPNIGGVETLFNSLANQLERQGHRVFILTRRSTNCLPSFEVVNGVEVRRLLFRNRFAFTFFSLPWVLFYGRRFDYIHTTSYNAAVPAFIGAKLLGKKCFITFHEYWGELWFRLPYMIYFSRVLYYWYEKLISKISFTKIIAVSEYTRQSLIKAGVSPVKIDRIYNGINYEEFCPFKQVEPTRFTIAYFGRIGVSKGVDLLLQAVKCFVESGNEITVKMIVPMKPHVRLDQTKRFVMENKLTENFIFLHELTERQLRSELCTSSCVVIPSYSEGFCFAAVETIAMGIPLVSSDMGALKEVVSGRFIKMEELTVSSLLDALEKAKAGQWTTTTIKHFTLEDSIEHYKRLYTSMK